MMLKTILSTLAILTFYAMSITACTSSPAKISTPQTIPAPMSVKDNGKIIAEGKVVPAKGAGLSFQVAGTIAEISTAVGDKIDAGQVLVSLDTKPMELQLAQAEGNLGSAQARLDQLKIGARRRFECGTASGQIRASSVRQFAQADR